MANKFDQMMNAFQLSTQDLFKAFHASTDQVERNAIYMDMMNRGRGIYSQYYKPKGLSKTLFTPFAAVDSVINNAIGLPVMGDARQEAQGAATGAIAAEVVPGGRTAAPQIAVQPQVNVIQQPTMQSQSQSKAIAAATPEAATTKRSAIKVSDSATAAAAKAAAFLSGDSGLHIDPLGRRGRGQTGYASMLGR